MAKAHSGGRGASGGGTGRGAIESSDWGTQAEEQQAAVDKRAFGGADATLVSYRPACRRSLDDVLLSGARRR